MFAVMGFGALVGKGLPAITCQVIHTVSYFYDRVLSIS